MRKIIHIDMDAFYASVEQRDNPQYRNKPVVVGYSGERGVIAAASYEARKFGIHSAMPSIQAKKKCPELIFIKGRMDVYKKVSLQIREIFFDYTDIIEPLSLDEAYLDVTVNKKNNPSATILAKEIKKRIKKEIGLTASAGVSINKFLAKIASDINKPDGLFVITDKMAEEFVEKLPIEKFWGVGKVTAKKMHSLGIYNGKDLKKMKEKDLIRHFGKAGSMYYNNARAIDEREVIAKRVRKSVGAENTFHYDIDDEKELKKQFFIIAEDVWARVIKNKFKGYTVTLKIKYSDFKQITRSKTVDFPIIEYKDFIIIAEELLNNFLLSKGWKKRKIRLMGLTLSNAKELLSISQLKFPF